MSILRDKLSERFELKAVLKDLDEIKKNQQDILKELKAIRHEQAKLRESVEVQPSIRWKPGTASPLVWYPSFPSVTKTIYGKNETRGE